MFCISITDYSFDDCLKTLKKCEKLQKKYPDIIAEVRLDLCNLTEMEVRKLYMSSSIPLMTICRKRTKEQCEAAIQSGAAYVDIDILSSESFFNEITPLLKKRKLKRLLSYHNYTGTPTIEELVEVAKRGVKRGADVIKIVTTANNLEEADRVLSLYEYHRKGAFGKNVKLIAFSMGYIGRYTRVEALNLGAPFMFCSLSSKDKYNIGQFSYQQMEKFAIGKRLQGEFTVPVSKSVAQRVIVAASLAKGESEFFNFSRCDDIDNALGVAKQVGAEVDVLGDTVSINGKGFRAFTKKSEQIAPNLISAIVLPSTLSLYVGESGLLSRLCIPIAAQLGEGVSITGGGTLLAREMYGCKESLEEFGAKCILSAENTLPAIVSGPLSGGKVTISGKKGSQLISGLLMALPLSKKNSQLRVTNATSLPYIKLTLDVISQFGIEISYQIDGKDIVFDIPGKQSYKPATLKMEGDWSSASNFIVAGALFGDVLIKGLRMDSCQADRAIVDIVRGCGGYVEEEDGGLRVKRSHLKAFEYDATNSPDLFPVLAVLAAYCEGESAIHGVERLRNKESDRKEAILQNFKKMGVNIEVEDGTMYIEGISPARRYVEGKMLAKGNYQSFFDHRIAMAVMIASLGSTEKMTLDNTECINKSFPQFSQILKTLKNG